jgi:hypothetical protein
MKSNKMIYRLGMLCLASAMLIGGCKKKEDPIEPEPVVTPAPEETGQAGVDSREATGENDEALNDINEALSNSNKVSGKGGSANEEGGLTGNACKPVIDSTQAGLGVLTLSYTGSTCNNRTKTGVIKLTLVNYTSGKRWKDTGAVLKVDYINYKIKRASDQKSLTFNGTQQLKNVSGGNWWNLLVWKNQTSLVTTVTGTNLIVTWHDNTTATYNIHRKITYSCPSPSVIAVKGEGIGTSGGLTSLENYGTSRQGDAFTSQVTTPIIWNTTCGGGAPLQGAVNVKVTSKNFDLIFLYGVDVNGNTGTTITNPCPYGWKLQWTVNNASSSKVFAYW